MNAPLLACYRCGAPDADPSDFLCVLCQSEALSPVGLRLRVLADPVIAAAVLREERALAEWTGARGAGLKTRRRLEETYLAAHRETGRLLYSRPRLDPRAPSAEVPS